eukprot:TRINITY_DN893_c0_g4_i2.p1 TRINITY_DN893_c0_g4~~TRINITY_DN893_c0_g4_i2.p1  ORF type:complete len:1008 (-),score=296.58 TRINITY_DN893_c0_g4_i2:872-3895(-)
MSSFKSHIFDYVTLFEWSGESGPQRVFEFFGTHDASVVAQLTPNLKHISQFCFPEFPSMTHPLVDLDKEPISFSLTFGSGEKRYGFGVRNFVQSEDGKLTNKLDCVCLISKYSWFSMFEQIIAHIERIRKENADPAIMTNAFLEAILSHPKPLPGEEFIIRNPLDPFSDDPNCIYRLHRSPDSDRILADVDISVLFKHFSHEWIVTLFAALIRERRVLVVGERIGIVSHFVHALEANLYPLRWQHIVIPILPSSLLSYVSAPMPFLIGCSSKWLGEIERMPTEEIVLVNLDSREIEGVLRDDPDLHIPYRKDMTSALKKLAFDEKTRVFNQQKVQYLFEGFFVKLFANYRSYMNDEGNLDLESFLSLEIAPKSSKIFVERLRESQMFEQWVHERSRLFKRYSASVPPTSFERRCSQKFPLLYGLLPTDGSPIAKQSGFRTKLEGFKSKVMHSSLVQKMKKMTQSGRSGKEGDGTKKTVKKKSKTKGPEKAEGKNEKSSYMEAIPHESLVPVDESDKRRKRKSREEESKQKSREREYKLSTEEDRELSFQDVDKSFSKLHEEGKPSDVTTSEHLIPLDPIDAQPSTTKPLRQSTISTTVPANVDDLLGGSSFADDGGETMHFTDAQTEESLLDFSGDPVMNPTVVEHASFDGDDSLDGWFSEKQTGTEHTKQQPQQKRIVVGDGKKETGDLFEMNVSHGFDLSASVFISSEAETETGENQTFEFASEDSFLATGRSSLAPPQTEVASLPSLSSPLEQVESSSSIDWLAPSKDTSGVGKVSMKASESAPALGMIESGKTHDFDESVFLEQSEENPKLDTKDRDLFDTIFSSEENGFESFDDGGTKAQPPVSGGKGSSWVFSSEEVSVRDRSVSAEDLRSQEKSVNEPRGTFSFDEFSSSAASDHESSAPPHKQGEEWPLSDVDHQFGGISESGKEWEGHNVSDAFDTLSFDIQKGVENDGGMDLLTPVPIQRDSLVPSTAEVGGGEDLIDLMEFGAEEEKKQEDWDSFF